MRLIKRYSNRKLYDTHTRTYITLEGVAALVVEGSDIKVVDNDTDEDLTTVILSQLLLERERSRRSLSSGLLSGLLRSGETLGRGISNLTRPLPLPGGWLALLEHEVERSFKFWLEMAQGSEEEVLRVIEGLVEKRRKARVEPPRPTVPGLNLLRRRDLDDFDSWESDQPDPTGATISEPSATITQQSAILARRLMETLPDLPPDPALLPDLQILHARLSNWLRDKEARTEE